MALDSINSYLTSSAQADMQYLQDGWDLDDKQAAVLHGIRKGTFNYMVETVREYQLPGKLALTEQAVSDFVIWKNKSNNLQVIQFFEENRETYQAFGPYWLTLADCYFRNGDYAKCLEAIAQYELLNTQIFRRDYEYARILPLAIIAAHEEQDTISYIETATRYSETILRNTTNNEWPLRYFAAQTFIELFSLTNNHDYLLRAYDIALSNVNYMVEEQKSLNSTYLENVKTITADKTATKSQQEEIKQYNKLLTEKRKTELPPIYEPLLLNCELLFSLAEELGMPETELQRIDGILHENGEPIFLIEPINAQYSMKSDPDIDSLKECIVFDGTLLSIPVQLVSEQYSIKVSVTTDGETIVYDDWTLEKVERKDKSDISSFVAHFSSKAIKKHKFAVGARISVKIQPDTEYSTSMICCDYNAVAGKTLMVFDKTEIQRAE